MELNFDLNTDDFLNEVEKSNGGYTIIDTDSLPFVESGMYRCSIQTAFKRVNLDMGTCKIDCTFVAFDGNNQPVGKFSISYDTDMESKYFVKTKELCYLTNNTKGLDPKVINGEKGDFEIYPTLANKPLVAIVYKKKEIEKNGKVYANYACYGLYNSEKYSCRELIMKNRGANVTKPIDIEKTYAFLRSKLAEDAKENTVKTTYPKPTTSVKPQQTSSWNKYAQQNTVANKAPTQTPTQAPTADDGLPF